MFVTKSIMMDRVESKSYITALPHNELRILKDKMQHLLAVEYAKDFHLSPSGSEAAAAEDGAELCARHVLDVEVVLVKTA